MSENGQSEYSRGGELRQASYDATGGFGFGRRCGGCLHDPWFFRKTRMPDAFASFFLMLAMPVSGLVGGAFVWVAPAFWSDDYRAWAIDFIFWPSGFFLFSMDWPAWVKLGPSPFVARTSNPVGSAEIVIGSTAKAVGTVEDVVGSTARVVGTVEDVVGSTAKVVRSIVRVVGSAAKAVGSAAEVVGSTAKVG